MKPSLRNPAADEYGDISIAQPKIWQFERMSALLDGLLRDIEGISVSDLTQLNANQQNAAALKFIQSALEVGVQYDQAAAVNAANTLSTFNATHASQVQQLDAYNRYMETLTAERNRLVAQNSAATNMVNALQSVKAEHDGVLSPAEQKQLDQAESMQQSTQAALTQVNSLITSAGAAPTLTTPPTLTGTSVQGPASGSTMSSSLSGFSDVLKSLPSGVQNNLSNSLQSPTFPASKQMDNFITLLYERMARQISALQDDLTRDPENVAYFLQFDVGLYPSKRSKDHVARVEFNLDCPGCKVYALYPGQSAYNLAYFSGSSKRNTFWGNMLTLIGLGISGSYRRQVDTLQGGLVQSVYTAGFLNGLMEDRSDSRWETANRNAARSNGDRAEQSFGWYYGAAPLEKLVSPGIRSTFALVTVPRSLIDETRGTDPLGNANACLPFHINGGWVSHDDPLRQDGYFSAVGEMAKIAASPLYVPTSEKIYGDRGVSDHCQVKRAHTDQWGTAEDNTPCYASSMILRRTAVMLPVSSEEYPLVARREKQKMHVLQMEYNTVYVTAPPAARQTTTVQSVVQTTNTGAGQTATQTTGQTTSLAVSNAPSSGAVPASPSLPCSTGQCASILFKLDRPVDPNLVVTVNGAPMMRVRDWRGRATSVLPPAQSGSDLPTGSGGAAATTSSPLQKTRSLLEVDNFAANSWIVLNSHELLLNVSMDVATEEEFPVIQLTDPSGTVLVPYELSSGVTELVVNGFHLKPKAEAGVRGELTRRFRTDAPEPTHAPEPTDAPEPEEKRFPANAPISTGPYAFSTYAPLFAPNPPPRKLFATIGEIGDLLIGFIPAAEAGPGRLNPAYVDWSGAHTQVILEDKDSDFAWSLSCDPQGNLLACSIPREAISRTYLNYVRACQSTQECPGRDPVLLPLIRSLQLTKAYRNTLALDGGGRSAASKNLQRPLLDTDLAGFQEAFVTSLHVWVEQFDPEGKNILYTPEPLRIRFLPISDDYWETTLFRDWHFLEADPDQTTLEECNYLPRQGQDLLSVALLGGPPPVAWKSLFQGPWDTGKTYSSCGHFSLTTQFLSRYHLSQIVFALKFPNKFDSKSVRTTVAMPGPQVGPKFGKAEIMTGPLTPAGAAGTPPPQKAWKVVFPVSQTTCRDSVHLPDDLLRTPGGTSAADLKKIDVKWENGTTTLPACAGLPGAIEDNPNFTNWRQTDRDGNLRLDLEIPKSALMNLPRTVEILRETRAGVKLPVAALPDLRALLLPSILKLDSLSATQFTLSGANAGAIDAVALEGGKTPYTLSAAGGPDFVLVTLPAASAGKPAAAPTTGPGGPLISGITLDSTGRILVIAGKNFGTATGSATLDDKPVESKSIAEWTPTAIQVALPAGKQPGEIIRVQVLPAALESDQLSYTVGQTQRYTCSDSSSAAPCVSSIGPADSKLKIVIKGKNFGSARGTVNFDGKPSEVANPWTGQSITVALPANSSVGKAYSLLITTGQTSSKQFVFTVGAPAAASSAPSDTSATSSSNKAIPAGTYAVVPLIQTGGSGTTATYMPLEATDENGKPLMLTVPDTTKQSTPPPVTPAPVTTCSIPCVAATCPATCTSTTAPAATPKSP